MIEIDGLFIGKVINCLIQARDHLYYSSVTQDYALDDLKQARSMITEKIDAIYRGIAHDRAERISGETE